MYQSVKYFTFVPNYFTASQSSYLVGGGYVNSSEVRVQLFKLQVLQFSTSPTYPDIYPLVRAIDLNYGHSLTPLVFR